MMNRLSYKQNQTNFKTKKLSKSENFAQEQHDCFAPHSKQVVLNKSKQTN